ncbi:hypothetical protein SPRG_22105, partial [Saprolegnia parasitica CBS 223.65]
SRPPPSANQGPTRRETPTKETPREAQRGAPRETPRATQETTAPRTQSASEETPPTKTFPKGDVRRQGTTAGRPRVPSFRPLYTAGGTSLRLPTATSAPPVATKWSPFGDPVMATINEDPLKPMYELLQSVDDDEDQELQRDDVPSAVASNASDLAKESLEPLLAVPTLKLERNGVGDRHATWQAQRGCVSNQATNDASLSELEFAAMSLQSSEIEKERCTQASFVKPASDENPNASHLSAKVLPLKDVDGGE